MTDIHELENEIIKIKQRNWKVEEDKSWETSSARRILLVVFTYVSIGLYMYAIGVADPWRNAVIPSIGFLLSTLSLPFFKNIWLKLRKKT